MPETLPMVIQTVLVVFLPALVLWANRHIKAVQILSPVVICYLLGLLLGNQPLIPMDADLGIGLSGACVALAIPLLLFSVNIIGWLRLAPVTVLSFGLAILSALVFAIGAWWFFADSVPEASKIAGMLVGVYVGGTPNMAAIGTALGVDSEVFVQLNAADVIVSIFYLLFLFTFAQRIWGLFLPPFPTKNTDDGNTTEEDATVRPKVTQILMGVGLSLVIVGLGAGASQLAPEGMSEATAILVITTLAIGASMNIKIRSLPGSSAAGHYFLYMFCIAIGTTAEFGKLLDSSLVIIYMVAFMLYGSIVLHLLLAWIFKIDRDTVIITSVAAVAGPALIAPVALALKNREIVVSGIGSGLVGYAIGNYLGMGIAWILS